MIIRCLLGLVSLFILSIFPVHVTFAAEVTTVIQVENDSYNPKIQIQLSNVQSVGTYSLIITNPKTGESHSKILNSNNNSQYMEVPIFSESGTYPYEVHLNDIMVQEGGVILNVNRGNPSISASARGDQLSVTVKGAEAYKGSRLFITSGTFSSSIQIKSGEESFTFYNVNSLSKDLTLASEVGEIANTTLDLSKFTGEEGDSLVPSSPPVSGSIPQPSNSGKPSVSQPNAKGKLTLVLKTPSVKIGEKINMSVTYEDVSRASSSVNVRFSTNLINKTSFVQLDSKGKGTIDFSTDTIEGTNSTLEVEVYSLGGEVLATKTHAISVTSNSKPNSNSSSANTGSNSSQSPSLGNTNSNVSTEEGEYDYSTNQFVNSDSNSSQVDSGGQEDASTNNEETATVEYANADLSAIDRDKVDLVWRGAQNLTKFVTKLKVTNITTNVSREYVVHLPNGSGSASMKLEYDGAGLYTWDLISNGKSVAIATYAVALGIEDPEPTSQNGLPVIKATANKDVRVANLNSYKQDEYGGHMIGEAILGQEVVADDVSGQDITLDTVQSDVSKNASSLTLIILLLSVLIVLIAVVIAFIVLRKRRELKSVDATSEEIEEYNSREEDLVD